MDDAMPLLVTEGPASSLPVAMDAMDSDDDVTVATVPAPLAPAVADEEEEGRTDDSIPGSKRPRQLFRHPDGRSNKKFREDKCRQIRQASNKQEALALAEQELLDRFRGNVRVTTVKNYYKTLRQRAFEENSELMGKKIPYRPEMMRLCKEVAVIERAHTASRFVQPMKVDGNRLIRLAVAGVRDGIDRKQVPQVLFCLNYLIGLRPNDLNPATIRPFATSASSDTHIFASQLFGGQKVVGTLLNLLPSKLQRNADPMAKAYACVFICHPSEYGLMRDAISFVFANASLPCTTCVSEFRNDKPSGPTSGTEWGWTGRTGRGIMQEMITRLKFNEVVIDWGSVPPTFTKALGRSFATSCVEQGIFRLGGSLRPYRAVELYLNHDVMSNYNVNYLKIDCRPGQYEDVELCAVEADDGVLCEDCDGRIIHKGVYLRQTSHPGSDGSPS